MSTYEGPIFDADNHLYETGDALTRYLPKQYEGFIKYVEVHGRTKIAINNVISESIPNPTFEVVAPPGSFADYFSGRNPEGKTLREMAGTPIHAIDAFRSAEPRLKLLDETGIDAALMFPTLASLIEVNLLDDPEMTCAVIHAYNQWLFDEWPFDYEQRIFTTPVVNPCLPERGIAELDWVLERGAKVVLLRPGPVAGTRGTRSPFLPEFDAFWRRIEESGVLVAMHASDSGYQRHANEWEGDGRDMTPFAPRPFTDAVNTGRPISDTITSAICHGMLSRFPTVRLLSVENGGSWALHCLKAMEKTYGKMPKAFAEPPREVFLRNIYINPFWEDSLEALIDVMTPEHILFGSDYPHPEGLAEPFEWAAEVSALYPEPDVRKIMGGNMFELLGMPLPA
jgi:predicted TIM-barrel fold metal-dependent hydrolase